MRQLESLGPNELGVTRSPRKTWLWAASAELCSEVRLAIDAAAGHARWSQPTRYGQVVANVSDLDIGLAARQAKETLQRAGYVLVRIEDPAPAPTWF